MFHFPYLQPLIGYALHQLWVWWRVRSISLRRWIWRRWACGEPHPRGQQLSKISSPSRILVFPNPRISKCRLWQGARYCHHWARLWVLLSQLLRLWKEWRPLSSRSRWLGVLLLGPHDGLIPLWITNPCHSWSSRLRGSSWATFPPNCTSPFSIILTLSTVCVSDWRAATFTHCTGTCTERRQRCHSTRGGKGRTMLNGHGGLPTRSPTSACTLSTSKRPLLISSPMPSGEPSIAGNAALINASFIATSKSGWVMAGSTVPLPESSPGLPPPAPVTRATAVSPLIPMPVAAIASSRGLVSTGQLPSSTLASRYFGSNHSLILLTASLLSSAYHVIYLFSLPTRTISLFPAHYK